MAPLLNGNMRRTAEAEAAGVVRYCDRGAPYCWERWRRGRGQGEPAPGPANAWQRPALSSTERWEPGGKHATLWCGRWLRWFEHGCGRFEQVPAQLPAALAAGGS
jgi:hypothetical protein